MFSGGIDQQYRVVCNELNVGHKTGIISRISNLTLENMVSQRT